MSDRQRKRLDALWRMHRLYEKYPKSKYFVPLANLYRALQEHDEALSVLKEGLKWHPNYVIARALLACVYFEMGQLMNASLEAQKVIDLDPKNLSALKTAIHAQLKLGETALAQKNIERLLRQLPHDENLKNLSNKLSRKGGPPFVPESDLKQFEMKPLETVFSHPKHQEKILHLKNLLKRVQNYA